MRATVWMTLAAVALAGGAGCGSRTTKAGATTAGLDCARVRAAGGWKRYFHEQGRHPPTPTSMAQLRLAARLMFLHHWDPSWRADAELVKGSEPVFSSVVGQGGERFDAVTMWAGDNPNPYLFVPGTTTLAPVAASDDNCLDRGRNELLPVLSAPDGRVQLLDFAGVDRDGTRLAVSLSVLVNGDALTSHTFSAVVRRGSELGISVNTSGLHVSERDGVLLKAEGTMWPLPPLPHDHWSITIDFGRGPPVGHSWHRDIVSPPDGKVRLTLRRGVTDDRGVVLTATAPLSFSRVDLHLDPAELPPGL